MNFLNSRSARTSRYGRRTRATAPRRRGSQSMLATRHCPRLRRGGARRRGSPVGVMAARGEGNGQDGTGRENGRADDVGGHDEKLPGDETGHAPKRRDARGWSQSYKRASLARRSDAAITPPGRRTRQAGMREHLRRISDLQERYYLMQNLGLLCRRHHRCKQLPSWHLTQDQPGIMAGRLPSGRIYQNCGQPYPMQS
jgi:hypothetical protein